jgi:hypothetical protein
MMEPIVAPLLQNTWPEYKTRILERFGSETYNALAWIECVTVLDYETGREIGLYTTHQPALDVLSPRCWQLQEVWSELFDLAPVRLEILQIVPLNLP